MPFCHTHPAEPFWQLEQTGADGCHKGNLGILKMLFSAHQSGIFENGNKRAWDQPESLQGLPLLQCLVLPCLHDCMLGKVWGNTFIPVVCLESSHV